LSNSPLPVSGPPDEFIVSDGGFESAWGADTGTQTLVDANLGAFLLVMEPGSLRTPHYADVPVILAVLEGKNVYLLQLLVKYAEQ
jgi:hypothetical protein